MQSGKWRLVRGGQTSERQKRNAEGEVEASERRENESEKEVTVECRGGGGS